MADVGGHAIHMAHYLFGKPEKLSSVLAYNNEYARSNNVETNARTTMVYPDDLLVSLECSFVSRGYEGMCIVRGTEGSFKRESIERAAISRIGYLSSLLSSTHTNFVKGLSLYNGELSDKQDTGRIFTG